MRDISMRKVAQDVIDISKTRIINDTDSICEVKVSGSTGAQQSVLLPAGKSFTSEISPIREIRVSKQSSSGYQDEYELIINEDNFHKLKNYSNQLTEYGELLLSDAFDQKHLYDIRRDGPSVSGDNTSKSYGSWKTITHGAGTTLRDAGGNKYFILGPLSFEYTSKDDTIKKTVNHNSKFRSDGGWDKAVDIINSLKESNTASRKDISIRKMAATGTAQTTTQPIDKGLFIDNNTRVPCNMVIYFDSGSPRSISLNPGESAAETFNRISGISISCNGANFQANSKDQLAKSGFFFVDTDGSYVILLSEFLRKYSRPAPSKSRTTSQNSGQASNSAPTASAAPPAAPAAAPAPAPTAAAAPPAAAATTPAPAAAAAETEIDPVKVKAGLVILLKLVASDSLKIMPGGIRAETKVWKGVIGGFDGPDNLADRIIADAAFTQKEREKLASFKAETRTDPGEMKDEDLVSAVGKVNNIIYNIKNKSTKRFLGVDLRSERQIAESVKKSLGSTSSLHELHTLSKVAARREKAKKMLNSAVEKENSNK